MRIPKSVRWIVMGAVARQLGRLAASRSVDRATEDLQQALPPSASKVVSALPDSVLRAGGAALATGKATRRAVSATRTATNLAADQTRKMRSIADRSRALVVSGRQAIATETAVERREMRSELALVLRGRGAADEALLDLRPSDQQYWPDESGPSGDDIAKLPTAADGIAPGRPKRFTAAAKPVARMQRLYRAPVKPWDRPTRRSPDTDHRPSTIDHR